MNTLQILRDNVDECINADGVFEPSEYVLDRIWNSWAQDNSYADLISEAVNGDEKWACRVASQAMSRVEPDNNRLRWGTLAHFRDFARNLVEEHAAEIEQYHREVNKPDPMDYDDVGRMIG